MSLPKIILVRHGVPAWDFNTPISGHDLAIWLEGERDATLQPIQRPSAELAQLVRSASCVIASPLRRSIDSARLIAPATVPLIDERFREPPLPCAIQSHLRLRPGVWTWLARSAWFCGWSAGVESFKAARKRAAEAARVLVSRAEDHGSVALMGHGVMNILIALQLRASGWRGPRFPPPRHWAFGVYVHSCTYIKEGGNMKPTPRTPTTPKIPVPSPSPQPPEPWEPAKIPRSPEPPKPPITKI